MTVLIIILLLTLAEHLYSMLLKDGVCSWANTGCNIGTQLCGVTKDLFVPALGVFGMMTSVDLWMPHLFPIPLSALSFVVCLLLTDFLYYVFHRFSHAFALPWMLHFVHHSGNKFNLSAGFRSSLPETVLLFVFYSPVLMLGFPPQIFWGVFQIISTYQFMTHSSYLKLPRWINYIFVTPSYHKIHHDQDIKNQNSNFGGVFSIWDRLFGTYVREAENYKPGLKGYQENNLIKIQIDPFLTIGPKLLQKIGLR